MKEQSNFFSGFVNMFSISTILYYIAWIIFSGKDLVEQQNVVNIQILVYGCICIYFLNYLYLRNERTIKWLLIFNGILYFLYAILLFKASDGDSIAVSLYLIIVPAILTYLACGTNLGFINRVTVINRFEVSVILMLLIMLALHLKQSPEVNYTPLLLASLLSFVEVIHFNLSNTIAHSGKEKISILWQNIPLLLVMGMIVTILVLISISFRGDMVVLILSVFENLKEALSAMLQQIANLIKLLADSSTSAEEVERIPAEIAAWKTIKYERALIILIVSTILILGSSTIVLIKQVHKNKIRRSKKPRVMDIKSSYTYSRKIRLKKINPAHIFREMRKIITPFRNVSDPNILYKKLILLCKKTNYHLSPGQTPYGFMMNLRKISGISSETIRNIAILSEQINQYYFAYAFNKSNYDIKIGTQTYKDIKEALKKIDRKN